MIKVKLTITITLNCFLICLGLASQKIQINEGPNAQFKEKLTEFVSPYNEIEMLNSRNFQYQAPITFGTPPQNFTVILDTGSYDLWIPAKNCSKCSSHFSKFKQNNSSTFTSLNIIGYIQYGSGYVSGIWGQDNITFQNIKVTTQFLLVDYEEDTQDLKADGIMGLSNWKNSLNIFDLGYQNGQLVTPVFGFKLGIKEMGEKSYFFYNISEDYLNSAFFIKTTRPNYWTIPIKQIRAGQHQFNVTEALIDTGTSTIIFPQRLYTQFNQKIFSKFCAPNKSKQLIKNYIVQIRTCECPQGQYPDITIMSYGISFDIQPSDYLIADHSSRKCYLMIAQDQIQCVILGDIFLQQHYVLFDKRTSSVGFIDNRRQQNQHFDSIIETNNNTYTGLQFICFVVLLTVLVIFCRKKKKSEPLRIIQSIAQLNQLEIQNSHNNANKNEIIDTCIDSYQNYLGSQISQKSQSNQ